MKFPTGGSGTQPHAPTRYLPLPAATTTTPKNMQGGFQPEMTRREAALILGLRESAAEERIKEAHRRIMIANHPDSGAASRTRDQPGTRVCRRCPGVAEGVLAGVSVEVSGRQQGSRWAGALSAGRAAGGTGRRGRAHGTECFSPAGSSRR